MLRAHAPLIAVSTVIAIMFYLVFRDLKSLRATLATVQAACAALSASLSAAPASAAPRAPGPPAASFKEVGDEADAAADVNDIVLPSETQQAPPGPTRATKRPGATKRVTYDV